MANNMTTAQQHSSDDIVNKSLRKRILRTSIGSICLGVSSLICGSMNLLLVTDTSDFPISLLVTSIWVGFMIIIGGVVGILNTKKKIIQTTVLMIISVSTMMLSLATVVISIISLSSLAFKLGVRHGLGETEETETSSNGVLLQQRQIVDGCQLAIALFQVFVCIHALHDLAWQASSSTAALWQSKKNPPQVAATTTSGGQIDPNISVAEYFERYDARRGYYDATYGYVGQLNTLNSPMPSYQRNDASIYRDFPDFDHFRNNILQA